jgi:hypothetical protein
MQLHASGTWGVAWQASRETKPPNPPPVGKAGFEVWVLYFSLRGV